MRQHIRRVVHKLEIVFAWRPHPQIFLIYWPALTVDADGNNDGESDNHDGDPENGDTNGNDTHMMMSVVGQCQCQLAEKGRPLRNRLHYEVYVPLGLAAHTKQTHKKEKPRPRRPLAPRKRLRRA